MISKDDVTLAQKKWSDGLLEIVGKHINNLDYVSCASDFIDRLYDYQNCEVLFKPTLARDIQFRKSKDAALSYFVSGNNSFPEDKGFALKKWTNVRWENSGIQVFDSLALAMGNYYFTNSEGVTKVEFSFVYKKNDDGDLKIILHDSHLPFQN